MWKKSLPILLLMAIPAFGLMIGNPNPETPYEKFGGAVEYDFNSWKLKYDSEPDYKYTSSGMFFKPSLGLFEYFDIYGYLGFSDINTQYHEIDSFLSNFDGSQEIAFGVGARLYYAVFFPIIGCKDCTRPLRCFVDASWVTIRSDGELFDLLENESYSLQSRTQLFNYGLYASMEWGKTRPYAGLSWTYMIGHLYWEPYSAFTSGVFAQNDGLYTYPQRYPKPVIGLDIHLGKGYVLSLETSYWGKSETSFGIGISQLYEPERTEENEEESLQKPGD